MKPERMTIKVSSAWDKSLVFGPQETRNFGSEVVEVDSPMPELPWEMQGINTIVNSLSNIHIATRTHETGYLAQLASTLIAPQIARRQLFRLTSN